MKNVTVLYYSASSENPFFEAKIREKLLANIGDLPLVSVTQEPLPNFGKNICVGKHDACYANEFRQIEIGLKSITTEYVLTAEADCLYPPEYFQFNPPEKGHFYRYANVWVQYYLDESKNNPKFYYKKFSDCAQACDTKLWLETIEKGLLDRPEWSTKNDPAPKSFASPTDPNYQWSSPNPVVTFKTVNGVSRYTQINRTTPPVRRLPFWGDALALRKQLIQ